MLLVGVINKYNYGIIADIGCPFPEKNKERKGCSHNKLIWEAKNQGWNDDNIIKWRFKGRNGTGKVMYYAPTDQRITEEINTWLINNNYINEPVSHFRYTMTSQMSDMHKDYED